MVLKLYNFLTRRKEVFEPLKKGAAGLYTCGPTVYNYAHIGNLRTYIFEDILRRTLEYAGYKVKHVMNITDVDDKIIKNAAETKQPLKKFTSEYEKAFFEDLRKLNIKTAWKYPEATAHIKEMVALVKKLSSKKFTYKTGDGVFFDISKFKNYGRLSRLKKREIKIGARIASDEYEKGSGEDFVLWKAAKPGEPSWPAPFGEGRPGWHLECSAMSMAYLGPTFDIHAGGVDLLFPHHENEIAQSEGATGKKFANYFLEAEHLMVNGRKMSKSLGNAFTLRDIEEKHVNPMVLRYLVLSAHYRTPMNFTWEALGAAEKSLKRLYDFAGILRQRVAEKNPERGRTGASLNKVKTKNVEGLKNFQTQRAAFEKALFDDLNTPKALAVLWETINQSHKNPEKWEAGEVLRLLLGFERMLGLGLGNTKTEKAPPEVLELLKSREDARNAKNFLLADEIRRKISEMGWGINDTASGTQVFHL